MSRFYQAWILVLLGFVILVSGCFLAFSGRAMAYYKQSLKQRSIVRGVENLDDGSKAITELLSDYASTSAKEQYDLMNQILDSDELLSDTETELDSYYKKGYCDLIRNKLGIGPNDIMEHIQAVLPQNGAGKLTIDDSTIPSFEVKLDDGGNVVMASLEGVTLKYDNGNYEPQFLKASYDIVFPKPVFYDGNEDLERYCMLARKGVYMTGETSSVVGDIYAGSHKMNECRDAEKMYGEIGVYGGLNIASTQVGFKSDRIISKANINMNSSFVMFSPENYTMKCFGREITELQGYNAANLYSMDGDFFDIDRLNKDVVITSNDKNILKNDLTEKDVNEAFLEYENESLLMEDVFNAIDNIGTYYDSDNDSAYQGECRKIISSKAVELSSDFTGLVITPQSIILDPGVTSAGLLISGDRIYTRGNNLIVSDSNVLREILKSENAAKAIREIEEEKQAKQRDITLGVDENKKDEAPEIFVGDYLGGLYEAGLYPPDYYVMPCVE